MNAPIRLLAALLLLAPVSAVSAGCAGGTPAGAPVPRLVREPLVGFDEGAAHTAASPASLQQARMPERVRKFVVLNPVTRR